MHNPAILTQINLNAYTAFAAVRAKLMALHSTQIKQEGKRLYADAEVLAKMGMYHLCLGYALLLKVYTEDPLAVTTDVAYWKNQTGYDSMKECAHNLGVDLDAIVNNTI